MHTGFQDSGRLTAVLHDVRVLELSLFSPDALGGHLADLGAEVIKIEQPGGGGFAASLFPPDNVQNLQWNRGKKSVDAELEIGGGGGDLSPPCRGRHSGDRRLAGGRRRSTRARL